MFWTANLIFIHVPRTGGTALTDLFGSLPHVSKDVHKAKHVAASVVRDWWPEYWECAVKFTIYRDNAEIAESWYRHVQSVPLDMPSYVDASFVQMVRQCRGLSREEYFELHPPPTMEQYVDCEGVQVLSWDEAYRLCRAVLGEPK